MKNIIKNIALVCLLVIGGYGIFLRVSSRDSLDTNSGKLSVVTTFYPLAYLAEQIGKDVALVTNLTPPGVEPHDFDPTPQDVARLHESELFFYNGAGFESWVPKLLPELGAVRSVDVSAGLDLLTTPEGTFDPHVWLDPVLYSAQADVIARTMQEVDPERAELFTKNARVLKQHLTELHEDFSKGLASCKRRDIVTSHSAFEYLAKRYNVRMISISGLSPDEEPTPARLAEISDFVQGNDVRYIFFETLVSPRLAETIARETGAQTISFNPLEGLSEEELLQGKDYISVQRENLQALRTALECI